MVPNLEKLHLDIGGRITTSLEKRTGRALIELAQLIRKAYQRALTATRGEHGALGAIDSEVKRVGKTLEATIGVGTQGGYLLGLEFGERGTEGGEPGGLLRTKAPSATRDIKPWLRRANIPTPKYYVLRAERMQALQNRKGKRRSTIDFTKPWNSTDPETEFASAIAIKRRKFGRPAMRVAARTIEQSKQIFLDLLSDDDL